MKPGSLAALGALLCAGAACAGQAEQMLKWRDLGPRIVDETVALVLPDGTSVRGKARAVDSAGLHLRVTKTSNKRVMPQGEQVIPRRSVSVLHMTEYRTAGRWAATLGAMAVAGTIAGVKIGGAGLYEGTVVYIVPAVAVAGTLGAGVGGYYFGKALDKRVTVIRVVPGE
jgi:hypothetical protein